MRIYADFSAGLAPDAPLLSPLLRLHWAGRPAGVDLAAWRTEGTPFTLASNPSDADIHVLPMEWNYYFPEGRMELARRAGELARAHGKRLLVWFSGDLSPIVPLPNAVIFQCGVDRTARDTRRHSAPFFIDDPWKHFPKYSNVYREKGERPVVGFCGYAAASRVKVAYTALLHARHNLLAAAGRTRFESMPVAPAIRLRARALRVLAASPELDGAFIVRDRYAAGRRDRRKGAIDDAADTREFYENIVSTDYTLCVRGFGNWSIRLFETMACGRVPLVLETGGVMPLEDELDWEALTVRVPSDELSRVPAILAETHRRMSGDDFRARLRACRSTWVSRLSLAGFMAALPDYLHRRGLLTRGGSSAQ